MTNAKQSIEIIEGLTVELTAEQLEEVSRKVQSAKDKAKKVPSVAVRRATVEDIVVITSIESGSVNRVGDIGKIITDAHDSHPYRVEVPGRLGENNWEYERCVRLATVEEIAKYEESFALEPKLKVGDWVRNIKDEDSDLTIGKVYKVNDIHLDGFVGVTDDLGDENGIASKNYEIIGKLTPFDRAGRKPNEFKTGDVVRVLYSPHALPEGTIFEVASVSRYYVNDNEGFTYKTDITNNPRLELVTPVESRVDRAEGADVA